MDIDNLKHAGMNIKEAKIYLFLIKIGEAKISQIAKETKINRSLLYSILEKLQINGVVSYIIKNNVRYYRPIEPEKILEILKEKEKAFESVLPDLISLRKELFQKPVVEILEGKEGIKTILNEILRLNQKWFAFNIPGKGPETLGDYVYLFEKERQKKKINLNVICISTKEGIKRGKEFSKMKYTFVRYAPEKYDSPASNYIYGDRVVIIFWNKNNPLTIRIIDKSLAESYKNYFEILWKNSKNNKIN